MSNPTEGMTLEARADWIASAMTRYIGSRTWAAVRDRARVALQAMADEHEPVRRDLDRAYRFLQANSVPMPPLGDSRRRRPDCGPADEAVNPSPDLPPTFRSAFRALFKPRGAGARENPSKT